MFLFSRLPSRIKSLLIFSVAHLISYSYRWFAPISVCVCFHPKLFFKIVIFFFFFFFLYQEKCAWHTALVCLFEVHRLSACLGRRYVFPFVNSIHCFHVNSVYEVCMFCFFLLSPFFSEVLKIMWILRAICTNFELECITDGTWWLDFHVGLSQANGFYTSKIHLSRGNQQLNNAFVSVTLQWNVDQWTLFSCFICC